MSGTFWPELKKLLATPDLPEIGPGPRAGVRSPADLTRELDTIAERLQVSDRQRHLLRALILLWHDHLESAHTIAQDIDDADGAFVHGIMHRREPDYVNARYWFRRVGQHPAFQQIGSRVSTRLGSPNESKFQKMLAPEGRWDAFAFIDACEQAGRGSKEANQTLRGIQGIESEVLLEQFATR
jgi:hypothetical protein